MGSELRRLSLILPEPTSAKDCPSAFRLVAPSLAGANACGALRELGTLGRRVGPPRQAARRGAVVGCGGPGAAFGTGCRRPCGRCQGRQGRHVLSTSRLRPVWQRCPSAVAVSRQRHAAHFVGQLIPLFAVMEPGQNVAWLHGTTSTSALTTRTTAGAALMLAMVTLTAAMTATPATTESKTLNSTITHIGSS